MGLGSGGGGLHLHWLLLCLPQIHHCIFQRNRSYLCCHPQPGVLDLLHHAGSDVCWRWVYVKVFVVLHHRTGCRMQTDSKSTTAEHCITLNPYRCTLLPMLEQILSVLNINRSFKELPVDGLEWVRVSKAKLAKCFISWLPTRNLRISHSALKVSVALSHRKMNVRYGSLLRHSSQSYSLWKTGVQPLYIFLSPVMCSPHYFTWTLADPHVENMIDLREGGCNAVI